MTYEERFRQSAAGKAFDPLTKTTDLESRQLDGVITEVAEASDLIEPDTFTVYLRYEEDVATAYRDYYRDQVVHDKRTELGRFLFGVSFATLGFIVTALKLSKPEFEIQSTDATWLIISGVFLLASSLCSLRLAIPRNQQVNPATLELVEFHRSNSTGLFRIAYLWFSFWLIGLVLGLVIAVK